MPTGLKEALDSVDFNGELCAHVIGWYGDGKIHRNVPYLSNDPYVIGQQLDLMQAESIGVVLQTWQGPLAPFQHEAAQAMEQECEDRGMKFGLVLDPWCAKLGSGTPTENIENALLDPTSQAMLNSKRYLPEKYVLDFNTGADLTALAAKFPTLAFLGFQTGFSWPFIPWNPAQYAKINALPTMRIPGLCMSFNDGGMPTPAGVSLTTWLAAGSPRDYNTSVWGASTGAARVLDSQAGQFFQSQLQSIAGSKYAAIVTWNDYDEQSSGPYEANVAAAAGVDWTAL